MWQENVRTTIVREYTAFHLLKSDSCHGDPSILIQRLEGVLARKIPKKLMNRRIECQFPISSYTREAYSLLACELPP